jgi:UDP:flavonoid glycosyltransferase YjiC (YdhE family)
MARLLFVAHVGQTLGHVVRAASVIREMHGRGHEVHLAAAPWAFWVVASVLPSNRLHPVSWPWSHNEHSPRAINASAAAGVAASYHAVLEIIERLRPTLVVGFPGLVSTLAARQAGIAHVSVLHGPFLAPLLIDPENDETERAIMSLARQMCAMADRISEYLHVTCGAPVLSYADYLATESVIVPQPQLTLAGHCNVRVVPFVSASIGPPFTADGIDVAESCYITFGSGNPCDITHLVDTAARVFRAVIVSTGSRPPIERTNVVCQPFIASESLAGRVPYVVSHGGLGTLGTFAAKRTRQLIIPTELDQATTAVYARRLGLAAVAGLEEWRRRSEMGRRFPAISPAELTDALVALRVAPLPPQMCGDGATAAADALEQAIA